MVERDDWVLLKKRKASELLAGFSIPAIRLTYQMQNIAVDTQLVFKYDSIGRFMSEDPIGHAGGDNLYAFNGDDPVNGSDPSGEGSGPPCEVGQQRWVGDWPYGYFVCDQVPTLKTMYTIVFQDQCESWSFAFAAALALPACQRANRSPFTNESSFTPDQIQQLGHVCEIQDCTEIRIARGFHRSLTFGHTIFLAPQDRCSLRQVAHEVFHVYQYNVFGFREYLRRGIHDRFQSGSPYDNSPTDVNSLEGLATKIAGNYPIARLNGCEGF